jgi:hypothetical protein
MANNIGREIAEAAKALEPAQVALVIFKALFETGPQRMSGSNKFIAVGTIAGGLIEWKKQLLAAQEGEAEKWKKRYEDAKAELDDVRLKLAILQKEQ